MVLQLKTALFMVLFLLAVPFAGAADVLQTQAGDVIQGRLVSLEKGYCTFSTTYGTIIAVPIQDITGLKTDDRYELHFGEAETLTGYLKEGEHGGTILQSDSAGAVSINPAKITSMRVIFMPVEDAPEEHVRAKEGYGNTTSDEPPLDFLSGSTVLLGSGDFELELGLTYKQNRASQTLNIGTWQRSTYYARQLEVELAMRAGLWSGTEFYVVLPWTYGKVHDVSTNAYVYTAESTHIGDISFGVQQALVKESANLPSITFNLGASAPTGNRSYRDNYNNWKNALDNGSGHWSLSPGLSFTRTTDPAIIFGGVSYQYAWERSHNGWSIKPGWGLAGYLGVGFGLSERLSLGMRISQGYSANMQVDGEIIHGSELEPLDLTFTGSYRAWDNWVITPHVIFGLNDDTGAPSIGMRFTRRF